MLKQKLISLMTIAFMSLTMLSSVNAAEDEFVIEGVSVVDSKTVEVSFNHDLYAEGLDMFDVELTNKETNEKVTVLNLEIPKSNVLALNLETELSMESEYTFFAVFVPDMDANTIDNGVDGVVDFIPNNVIAGHEVSTEEPMMEEEVAEMPTEEPMMEEEVAEMPTEDPMMEEEVAEMPTDEPMMEEETSLNAADETMVEATTEEDTTLEAAAVATETEELPQTGPREMLFVLIAMLLSLGFLVARRKA